LEADGRRFFILDRVMPKQPAPHVRTISNCGVLRTVVTDELYVTMYLETARWLALPDSLFDAEGHVLPDLWFEWLQIFVSHEFSDLSEWCHYGDCRTCHDC